MDISEYKPVHRCLLCNKLVDFTLGPISQVVDDPAEFMEMQRMHMLYTGLERMHPCSDGRYGRAVIAGIVPIEDNSAEVVSHDDLRK